MPLEQLLRQTGSGLDGLGAEEAAARLRGIGAVAPHHRRTELVILLRQFATPITLILVVATLLSAALGEVVDAAIILAIILLSGFLSFWQEYAASEAMEELLRSVEVKVKVRRDGESREVRSHEVVPGDIVLLETGDLIPGDCRLVEADDLLVDEAPLTGESYPNEKAPGLADAEAPVSSRTNSLFRGTHVVRGSARALAVHVGPDTEFGRTVERLEHRVPPTSFERGISAFGALLLRVMVVLVTVILIINISLDRPLIDSLLFSLALAVGLTPQLLPAIVSISLSLGARQMARADVIVKRLSAIEDFGGMTVLCTDKTGTLTTGNVELHSAEDIDGNPSAFVMECAYLNAFHHTGYANPIDDAILAKGPAGAAAKRIDEIPYDFMRKRLSVLVRRDAEEMLLMKGAVENVLATCIRARASDGSTAPLQECHRWIRDRFHDLSGDGYRVLGVAYKAMSTTERLGVEDETDMVFGGFLVLEDSPKPGITETLRGLAEMGISLRMVTGDNRLAAAHIAREVGLDGTMLLTGEQVQGLSEEALVLEVERVTVFAEVDPLQKERIVRALRHRGLTVGFLGDGINDAPALHAADVGISVDTGEDVAKESASIVLLRKDLAVLMEGVRLGRQTFANTLKYVFVTTSANFGNMASMAGAALFLPFLPLLPSQILLLNFLSDLPATTISSDAVDVEQVQRPESWNIHAIRNFMILFGIISSAFDFLTFAILRLVFDASHELFRSGWFLESLGTELAVMLILRTRRRFYRSRPSKLLLTTSLITALVSLVLVLTPIGHPLGFVPVPVEVLVSMAGVLVAYVVATELGKSWFYRRAEQRTAT
ncbi:MAG TPA: magnesium-translocating P-type ATPase [Dehalococcoidia bacterium]